MSLKEACSICAEKNYQNINNKYPAPKTVQSLINLIGKNLNKPIYFYKVTTVQYVNNKYLQLGCSPNIEGNYITLTACKHYMRTFSTLYEGIWVAGITSKNLPGVAGDCLFYLALINKTFESQFLLSEYLKDHNPKTFQIKSTFNNPLGDIFIPLNKMNNLDKQLDYHNYKPPCPNHSHRGDGWHNDINSGYKRISKPLLFDPIYSYVWQVPTFHVKGVEKLRSYGQEDTLEKFLQIITHIK